MLKNIINYFTRELDYFIFYKIRKYLSYVLNLTLYFNKKYLYTINHKRIALNYLYFSFWTALSGTTLATMIRLELAYPGSHFFKGDSLKYLQVITAHGLIMVFFVVIPIIFGFFANFFIPYHIGSKDVAFPRLNSIGFWIQPAGYFLLAKTSFLRPLTHYIKDSKSNYDSYIKHSGLDLTNLTLTRSLRRFDTSKTNFGSIIDAKKPSLSSNFKENLGSSYLKSTSCGNTDFNIISKTPLYGIQKDKLYTLTGRDLTLYGSTSPNKWSFFYGLSNGLFNKFRGDIKSNSFFTDTKFITCPSAGQVLSGWTFITPFSGKTRYTGAGAQDIAILSVIFAGISTTLSFTNLLITRRTLSMPGLRYRKALIPFLSISLFLVMRMLTLITPVLGAAMIMLYFDRHYNTSFFDYSYGGDTVLFHHLFWFFGHPEVYVILIPAFGIVNMLIPFYNHRRMASKNHLIWATYIMGYMGFLVWGHHMYLIGLDHRSRSMYSTITVMISLPAIVKIVNWTLTFLNSAVKYDTPLLFVFSFFLFFLCGGLTGLWLSHVGLNVFVHDTFYVVAHFHFMFSCSIFSAVFAAIYYYFFIIFGKKYNRPYSYLHLFYWFTGQWLTFLPLFWVGYNGLPRRYHDYPLMFAGWQGIATTGHILNIISVFFFFLVLLDSNFYNKEEVPNNFSIPRFYKRVQFFLYKVTYRKFILKKNLI